MNAASDDLPGFAPDDDAPTPYMDTDPRILCRSVTPRPYRWTQYVEAPFQPLRMPLAFDAQKEIARRLRESAA
jgi:hypothetical protein